MKAKTRKKIKHNYRKMDALDKYIYSDGKQPLPIIHDGADITKPLNPMRLAEFHKCQQCKSNSVLTIKYTARGGKKKTVDVCMKHWGSLAKTSIGWTS